MINLNIIKQSTIVHVCFAISYFTSGLALSMVQACLYFGLRPFNKRLYRKINYYLAYSLNSRKYLDKLLLFALDLIIVFVFYDSLLYVHCTYNIKVTVYIERLMYKDWLLPERDLFQLTLEKLSGKQKPKYLHTVKS